jgi:hypothetical protein
MNVYIGKDENIEQENLIKFAEDHHSLILTKDGERSNIILGKAILMGCKNILVVSIHEYMNNSRCIKDKSYDSIVVEDAIATLSALLVKSVQGNKNDITGIDAVSIIAKGFKGHVESVDGIVTGYTG